MSTPRKAAEAEYQYFRRTSIGNIFRDSKHGAALRHLPSGYTEVSTAWMWASLITAAIAAWLHQLTGLISGDQLLEGHGTRSGKAMITTLRRTPIATPARLVRHGWQLIMRLLPDVPAILRAGRPQADADGTPFTEAEVPRLARPRKLRRIEAGIVFTHITGKRRPDRLRRAA